MEGVVYTILSVIMSIVGLCSFGLAYVHAGKFNKVCFAVIGLVFIGASYQLYTGAHGEKIGQGDRTKDEYSVKESQEDELVGKIMWILSI